MALWDWETHLDHWLHHQLQQARRLWHSQLRHPEQIGIRATHQNQLTGGDAGMRSSQLSPVHLEVTYEVARVVPAQSGVEE